MPTLPARPHRADLPSWMALLAIVALALGAACGEVKNSTSDLVDAATPIPPGTPDAGCGNGSCECGTTLPCGPDVPVCDPVASTCTECTATADCAGFAGRQQCADDGACVGCRNDADCAATGQACLETTRACGACTADADCESGLCDETNRACIAEVAILYVTTTGSGTVCTKPAPCATLALAHTLVTEQRRHILVAPGRYEGVSLTGKAVAVESTGVTFGSTVTVEGDVSIRGAAFDRSRLVVQGGNVRLSALRFTDAAVPDVSQGAIHVSAGNVVIEDTTVERSKGMAIATSPTSQVTVSRCTLINSSYYGISLLGTVVVRDSRIIGNGTGIISAGTRPSITIVNNVIAHHRGMGLMIATNPGFIQVEHNTIVFNQHVDRAGGVDCTDVTSRPTLRNNILWGNTADIATPQVTPQCLNQYSLIGPVGPAAGTGNVNADPRFADAASNDYRVLADSPARDAADPAANRSAPAITVTADANGVARPSGARSDIGAYELPQ